MNDAIWGMLNKSEKALLREVQPGELDGLDEAALIGLHDRVRRVRNKYAKLYRRRAAEEVQKSKERAKGHARHERTLTKAEAFEEALARVSKHLSRAAKAEADALRAERLELARGPKGAKAGKRRPGGAKSGPGRQAVKKARKPIEKKSGGATRSSNKRRQAARDAR